MSYLEFVDTSHASSAHNTSETETGLCSGHCGDQQEASVGDEGAPLCALPRAALCFQQLSGLLWLIVSVEEAGKL